MHFRFFVNKGVLELHWWGNWEHIRFGKHWCSASYLFYETHFCL